MLELKAAATTPGFVFWDRVFLCHPGCPGTHYVDHVGLEPTGLCLLLSSRCLGSTHHHTQHILFLCLSGDRYRPIYLFWLLLIAVIWISMWKFLWAWCTFQFSWVHSVGEQWAAHAIISRSVPMPVDCSLSNSISLPLMQWVRTSISPHPHQHLPYFYHSCFTEWGLVSHCTFDSHFLRV